MATQPPKARASKRRSTRVAAGVSMNVRGTDGDGKPFVERRVTLEVSFQGCRYYSRYDLPKDTSLTVEISIQRKIPPLSPTALVWSGCEDRRNCGECSMWVEFEAPGNIWGLVESAGGLAAG